MSSATLLVLGFHILLRDLSTHEYQTSKSMYFAVPCLANSALISTYFEKLGQYDDSADSPPGPGAQNAVYGKLQKPSLHAI